MSEVKIHLNFIESERRTTRTTHVRRNQPPLQLLSHLVTALVTAPPLALATLAPEMAGQPGSLRMKMETLLFQANKLTSLFVRQNLFTSGKVFSRPNTFHQGTS